MISREELMELRNRLLDSRREALERVEGIRSGTEALQERERELEEQAQKLSISELFGQLDDRSKTEIEEIDLALTKMASGDYGICESCGDQISLKRLKVLPAARLCLDCARDYERRQKTLQPAAELMEEEAEVPDELQGLNGRDLRRAILERIEEDGRVETDELHISVDRGVIYLEGSIPSTREHGILMQILTDSMGFASVVDHLDIDEVGWEREDRTPDTPRQGRTVADQLLYDQEDTTDDVFEAEEEETPYEPANRPLPENE